MKLKLHHNKNRLGLRPRPQWGSLQCSPTPPSWISIYRPFGPLLSGLYCWPFGPPLWVIPLFGFQMLACLMQDYALIVKTPMDLSTICRKLEADEYRDPWEYVDDMQLMFSNAWLYNRRSSPVYKNCTKVQNRFTLPSFYYHHKLSSLRTVKLKLGLQID